MCISVIAGSDQPCPFGTNDGRSPIKFAGNSSHAGIHFLTYCMTLKHECMSRVCPHVGNTLS